MERSGTKTDLVISMTLAETFLLLLFVVWFATKSEGSPDFWRALAEERLTELNKAKAHLNLERERANKAEKSLAWWRNNFNADPPRSLPELVRALKETGTGKQVEAALRRGLPACDQVTNVLVEAVAAQGDVQLRVVADSPPLRTWAQSAVLPLPERGTVLRGWSDVTTYVAKINRFYHASPQPCRFDYRLMYRTKEDYYDARQTLERAFYPAGITQLTQLQSSQ